MKLSKDEYIAAVASEAEAIADTISIDHLPLAVPRCPGWSLERLVGHVGRIYCSVGEQIRQRPQGRVQPDRIPRPPEGEAIRGWFTDSLASVLEALRSLEPEEEIWSWSKDKTGGFYHRRMAHETAIHRWDAQSAVGVPDGFDGDFAADGVDEMLGVVLPFQQDLRSAHQPEGSLHLHRTDGPGEWLCWMEGGDLRLERRHAKGDAAVRASAEKLIMALWGCIALDELEVLGDRRVAEEWMSVSS